MFIVVTEILCIAHCLRLKTTQCFRAWRYPNLQVNQEEARTYVGRPLRNSWSQSLCFWHVFTTTFFWGLKLFLMISSARFFCHSNLKMETDSASEALWVFVRDGVRRQIF